MNMTDILDEEPILIIEDLEITRGQKFKLTIDRLAVNRGEILAIIGPNGAGKSTFLLALTKFLPPKHGQISFHGKPITSYNDLEYRRRIGMVLQEPLLLDMTVFENIALGLKFRGYTKETIRQKTRAWIERLNLREVEDKRASQISGGQSQRASLARALVIEPEVLLLDEPFASLDQPARLELIKDLRKLLSNSKHATIFITHIQEEALMLADRVAIFINGTLKQVDTPQKVFSSPVDFEVAEFVGIENILHGRVEESYGGSVVVNINGKKFHASGSKSLGDLVFFCVRPDDITLHPKDSRQLSSARNNLIGRVTSLITRGPLVQVNLDCGVPLVAMITRASLEELDIQEGVPLMASFKASAVHLIDR